MVIKVRFAVLLVIFGLLFLFGCHSSKRISLVELFESDITEDVICFLVMDISRSEKDSKSHLNLKQTTQTNGRIKTQSILLDNPNKLIFSILGDTSVLSIHYLDHPIFKKMEHSHEQDGLATQTVILTKEEFFMRLPLNAESKYIKIEEKINGATPIELITLKI
jgi:hypothetical protein